MIIRDLDASGKRVAGSFLQISKSLLADTRLDALDVVIMVRLLDHHDDWKANNTNIRDQNHINKETATKYIRRLVSFGYLRPRDAARGGGGRYQTKEYDIIENPTMTVFPSRLSSHDGFSVTENPSHHDGFSAPNNNITNNNNTNTYSGSAAEQSKTVSKNQKIDMGTPQLASLIDLVKSELYSATVPMPAYAIKDISEAVSLYPMDMIHKAIEKTKKFHKHSFAYTLRILNSWQEEINSGNPEPWNFKKNQYAPSNEENGFGIDLDELDRNQVFPWDQ